MGLEKEREKPSPPYYIISLLINQFIFLTHHHNTNPNSLAHTPIPLPFS